VRITRAASAFPLHRVTQEEAVRRVVASGAPVRRAAAIARGSKIESRATVLPAADIAALGCLDARNAVYRREAPALAAAAAAAVLEPATLPPPRFVATSSCTGVHLPGLSAELAVRLDLPRNTARVPVTEAGCAGGVVALALAVDHLRSRPGASALAVAAELCSLAYHAEPGDEVLTSNLIFGDGAGAALLEARPGPGIEVVATASHLVPAPTGALGFELTAAGFRPYLGRDLPRLVPAGLSAAVLPLLRDHGLQLSDISAWLLHPGGARIIDGIEACLALDRAQTRWTRDSLAANGNTSSAAIFDVVARYLAEPAPVGSWAFGPGIAVEVMLGRRRC
jgi:alkylresorcinol/alkylpyrone synthase